MIDEIRRLLRATPFSPFIIKTSDGERYLVPTPDHATVTPGTPRVVVFHDDDSSSFLPALHLSGVDRDAVAPRGRRAPGS